MPPTNNLANELKWLYRQKPHVPPAIPLDVYDPHAPTASETTSFENLPPNHDPDPPSVQARPPSIPPALRAVTRTIDIHKPLSEQNVAADMARLRATPGSGKPFLVIAGLQPRTAQSTPVNPRTSHTSDNSSSRNLVPSALGSWPLDAGGAATQGIEAIDLTDEPTPSRRGKKRKSDDLDQERNPQKSPRPTRKAPVPVSSPEYDGFKHIDEYSANEYLQVPESPPPPYSTTTSPPQNARRPAPVQEDKVDRVQIRPTHVAPGNEAPLVDPMDLDQPIPNSRKRKSLSRAPSETNAPVAKLANQHCSPSLSPTKRDAREPTSTTKFRDAVMDSEEEDFESLSDIDMDDIQGSAQAPATAEIIAQDRHTPAPSQRHLPIRSPLKPTQPTVTAVTVASEKPKSPRKQHAPVSKTGIVPVATPDLNYDVPSVSQISNAEIKAIEQIVEVFLRAEGRHLMRHVETAVSVMSKAKKTCMDLVEVDMPIDEHQAVIVREAEKKKALEQMIAAKTKYEELKKRRKELRDKMNADMDNAHFVVEDMKALSSLSNEIKQVQIRIHHLLTPTGMSNYMTPAMDEPRGNTGETVVESTPTTPQKPAVLDDLSSSPVPQTQYAKQKDVSVRGGWSPSRQIRFAERYSVAIRPTSPGRKHAVQNHEPIHTRQPKSPGSRTRTDRTRQVVRPDPVSMPDDEYGSDWHIDEGQQHSTTRNAAPKTSAGQNSIDADFDEYDDSIFDAIDEVEHQPSELYDWKGDKVTTRHRTPTREVPRNGSAKAAKDARAPSLPKKAQSVQLGMNHSWSREVKDALLHKFHLKGFRPGQLEAINTTLGGEHCFVLMPTGGGKSLCYQLPSVISSGSTKGVTIVVSPLLSLMEDQVTACKNRFGMQAFLINGQSTPQHKKEIFDCFERREPGDFIQLLYITPEMLGKNQKMLDALQKLNRRNRLARVVIDEAHCVSQWGHDFRPDYKAVGDVLRQFSGVPIIALTATATQLVRTDVMANLGINGCRVYTQSFNRPNLSYHVLPKKPKSVETIASMIKEGYSGKCGIVYCLSRMACEQTAKKLAAEGILAFHYHAGMTAEERSEVQLKWQANEYHVIVATIAFGMGIDKADVRFVIHHTLPKSLEGYYQETGRAGRDGNFSDCFLLYQYGDSKSLRTMIEKGDGSRQEKQRQRDMLRLVVQFCENKSDCRRAQVLNYFSESFDRKDCKDRCDNCASGATFEERDFTEYVGKIIQLVRAVQVSKVTVLQCVDAFRDANNARLLKDAEVDKSLLGAGRDLERGDVERLFNHLVEADALDLESVRNASGFPINYVILGPKHRGYESGARPFKMQVLAGRREARVQAPKPKRKPAKSRTDYPSTNVSSPSRPPNKKGWQKSAYKQTDDDEEEEDPYTEPPPKRKQNRAPKNDRLGAPDDDENFAFAPIAEAQSARRKRQTTLGTSITVDQRISALDEVQRDMLDNFMRGTKEEIKKIKMQKSMRTAPFSDTILREFFFELPSTLEDMQAIPGIRADMVTAFGRFFLPFIEGARTFLGGNKPMAQRSVTARGQQSIGFVDDGEDDDEYQDEEEVESDDEAKPWDPNHVNVIDLTSEIDDDLGLQEDERSEDASFLDEDDDNDQEHTSHFFNQPPNPEVVAFNMRVEAIPPRQSSSSKRKSGSFSSRGGSSKASFRKGGFARTKRSRVSGTTSHAGVAKSGGRSSRPAGGAGYRRGGGAAGGGTSSIRAMPA